MQKIIHRVLFVVAAVCTSAPATAEILYELDSPVQYQSGGMTLSRRTSFDLRIRIREAGYSMTPILAAVFDGLTIDMSQIGQVFVADSSNDPGFDDFAALITDGIDMKAELTMGPGYSGISSESCTFYLDSTGNSGVDFHGYVIDRVTFQVKGWYHESPGRNPNGDGFWTDTYFGRRMTIEGHPVPEPALAVWIALGGLGLIAVRRRKLQF